MVEQGWVAQQSRGSINTEWSVQKQVKYGGYGSLNGKEPATTPVCMSFDKGGIIVNEKQSRTIRNHDS